MFSATSSLQIRNDPTNNSLAKYQWSFSKAPRFGDQPSYCKSFSYDKNSSLSNRKAGIGYGSRSAFFDGKKQSIAPSKYQTLSELDVKLKNKRGYSFTCNRDEVNFANYLKIGEKTPSPMTYEQNTILDKKSNSYSLRKKLQYPKNYFIYSKRQEEKRKKYPGPGRYETIDQLGSTYFSSKNVGGGRASFIRQQRFLNEKRTPGPGDYEHKGLKPDGNYFVSTMRISGRAANLSEKRQLKLDGNKYTPGPGAYRLPSQFGHYECKSRPSSARK